MNAADGLTSAASLLVALALIRVWIELELHWRNQSPTQGETHEENVEHAR